MSKLMDVFEKLNLVEKVNDEANNEVNDEVNDEANDNSKIDDEIIEKKVEPKDIEIDVEESYTESFQSNTEKKQKNSKLDSNHERNMHIHEIYDLYGIENSNVNTVFMLGNFINALPESLPYEVKKQSLMGIIAASNTNLRNLLSDGEKRLNALSKYTKEYNTSINNIIKEYNEEITKLNNLINTYNEEIHVKEAMLQEQSNTVQYEIEKINSIINFFKKGD
ncbi:hypothetical protein [Clostridium magnum]|uniref:Uncharacterized protein n=1 Tax=Clostridium magnum DSM 2767 TaxID=1121326 RepID=A0A161YR46_9CLOT|nr:hypothetical protein [Clostridium magnum]KZL93392.1 hypothetical protein CLMAG_04160 [Clostridium magnum DSM 2767]SHI15936.1 hypothetical protein SAMN02745944_02818 [Clostridium magnum DSM 2767]